MNCSKTLPWVALALLAGACANHPLARPDLVGSWRAELTSPGGPLPFELEISQDSGDGALRAVAINGEERVAFGAVHLHGNAIELQMDWYDSEIRAELAPEGDRMRGRWRKTAPAGGDATLAFEAHRVSGTPPRFAPLTATAEASSLAVAGPWAIEFTDASGSEPARGEFRQDGQRVTGTILTPVGDYRYLDGSIEAGRLRLSTFDGAHAFLFDATVQPDGSLKGDFWSRDSYHATWTARRALDGASTLPDAWDLVGLTNSQGRFDFEFPDLNGNPVSLADDRFAGKVTLVNIFGSWCPNCHDKAPLLADWYARFRDQGLEIVGLAYEFSGDAERDREQLRRFALRHGIEFPLLLAGLSDKQQAAETLPDLTGVVAFPTTVFIGRDGLVRRIHTGFAGPGTGEHHRRLVGELEGLVEELLAEPR